MEDSLQFQIESLKGVAMFCPKCGQEQIAEVPNYCSRCGFLLTEVTSLIARGGAALVAQDTKPPRDRAKRAGLGFLMAAFAFFVITLCFAVAEDETGMAILGFLSFVSFLVGSIVLLSRWVRALRRRRSESARPGPQTTQMDAPKLNALSSAYEAPVDLPKARFDTGQILEPPSVTENTTWHLDPEPPPASKQTR